MDIRLLLLGIALATIAATVATASAGENGVSVHGALRVDGTQLVNARGEPLQLRGMSSHGLQWYPEYINCRALYHLKWRGANLFRLAMYADSELGGYNDGEENRLRMLKTLRQGVENVLAADMYVIVDWHILKDENPLKTVESAEKFFDEISRLYAGNPAVIYEICNEPNGDTSWADIAAYAERIIPVIRKNAPDAVILVGTPHYSSRVHEAMAAPLAHDNIMYVYHFYTEWFEGIPAERLDQVMAAGLPVFVSEWGMTKGGTTDAEQALDFIRYMRERRLSWANWSLCNKDEPFSAIRPEVTKLSDWTDEDLPESGRIAFAALGEP